MRAEDKQECLIEYPICITSTGALVTAAVGLVSTVLWLTCGKKAAPKQRVIPAQITLRMPADRLPATWKTYPQVPAHAVRSAMLAEDALRAELAVALKAAYGVDLVPEHVQHVTFLPLI